jgi:large subunit ribosomal protein L22
VSAERRQAPEGGWGELTVDELKTELEARGLPKSGKKDELIARLDDDDASATAEDTATTPEAQEASEEAAAAADADEEAAEEQPRRRRGSAETSTSGQRRQRAPRPEGDLVVRARARYVRTAPRKARLVMNHIRGKRVEQAQAILTHAPRAVSGDILKLLNSAVANAESAYELGPDELTVRRAYVDEGPTIKRFRPRALGRATKIAKRTSHMTIELTTEGNGR